jgi:hypothetical protein
MKTRLLTLLFMLCAAVTCQPAFAVNLASGDSLTATMSGAIATTNPTYNVDYTIATASNTTKTTTVGSLTGVTAKTLVTANAFFETQSVSICNIDTAAVTITVAKVSSGTSYTLATTTLQVGDTLTIDSGGFKVIDTTGQIKQSGGGTAVIPHTISLGDWRKTDGVTVNAATAATTNFGLVLGTDGTDFPHFETIDSKAATTAVVARCPSVRLPPNYVAGSAITLRARCGMKTTVADNTNATTIDFFVYSNSGVANLGSADLCATAAQSINSLTASNYDFTITPTGLVAGQDLHAKMVLTVTDAATATAVIGTVNHVELRCSVNR